MFGSERQIYVPGDPDDYSRQERLIGRHLSEIMDGGGGFSPIVNAHPVALSAAEPKPEEEKDPVEDRKEAYRSLGNTATESMLWTGSESKAA